MRPEGGVSYGRVVRLSLTAVKGTRLREVERVQLEVGGVPGDRRFFVVDEASRMINAKHVGALQQVVAEYDAGRRELSLELPDGSVVCDEVALGEEISARFYSDSRVGRVVAGGFAAALSRVLGQPVRLLESPTGAIDRGEAGAVSLVSSASVARLGEVAGCGEVDSRRFRMLVEVDGVGPHEEDGWVGREVRVGGATVRFSGHVGRCLITSRDPESGEVDLPTLEILGRYRREVEGTEPLPFGIYGKVVAPGPVALGDPVGPSGPR